jgi:hypothetical protein
MPLAHQHPLTKKIKEKRYKDANDYLADFTVA